MNTPTISIIIPVYNEAAALGPLLTDISSLKLGDTAEIIVVDDGSTDQSSAIAAEHHATIHKHHTNRGYGASLKTGILAARGTFVITLDGDGQHSAHYIPEIIRLLQSHDMVIGQRSDNAQHDSYRMVGKWLVRMIGEFLVGKKLPDFNSGLRGFNRKLILNCLHIMPNGFSFSTTSTIAFLQESYAVGTLPIDIKPRVGRKSTVRFFRDGAKTILLILRMITLFNPLKLFFPASALLAGSGTIWGLYGVITDDNLNKSSLLLILVGVFIFFFGLIADQLSLLNRK